MNDNNRTKILIFFILQDNYDYDQHEKRKSGKLRKRRAKRVCDV